MKKLINPQNKLGLIDLKSPHSSKHKKQFSFKESAKMNTTIFDRFLRTMTKESSRGKSVNYMLSP